MNSLHQPWLAPSLLRRTQLLPGESLASLLERLRQRNYYLSATIWEHVCLDGLDPPANQDDPVRPKWVETFLRLAALTQISPEVLFAASAHRFAPLLARPQHPPVEIPWIGATSKAILVAHQARERVRSASAAQYCPQCLQAAAYHRLRWIPTTAAICLQHRCLLVDQCPQCQRRIAISEIVQHKCRVCDANLSMAACVSVENDELGALSQSFIQSWLVDDAPPTNREALPSQHPAALYRFLENLARRLLSCREDWASLPTPLDELSPQITTTSRYLPQLKPVGVFHLHRAAFAGLVNWPTGIFQFLDAYSGCYAPNPNPAKRLKRLKQIQKDWFQPARASLDFKFAQQALVEYLAEHDLPMLKSLAACYQDAECFTARARLWPEARAAQALGISVPALRRLKLLKCLWVHSSASFPLYEREKILAVRQKWASGWSLIEASCWLGLKPSIVRRLVECGLISVVEEPANHLSELMLERHSVETFFRQVDAELTPYLNNHRDLVSLEKAAKTLSKWGVDQADLLYQVWLGLLPAYKPQKTLSHLGCVYFVNERFSTDLPFTRRHLDILLIP